MSNYYYLELDLQDDKVLESLEEEAFGFYSCTGTQDFAIEEAKVDSILGMRSYSGGDLPREVLDEVEDVLKSEGSVKKTFYFGNEADSNAFYERLGELGLSSYASQFSGESKDWNENWKKNFKKIIVNDDLEVIPSWEKSEKEENGAESSKGIFIYPGMGFGTGSHETTFLCLKLMLEEIKDLDAVNTCLDFGCGSGILGIGFAQRKSTLGSSPAKKIDYLDIDKQALENCEQNLALNEKAAGVPHQLFLSDEKSELLPSYDLVFANILLDALIAETETVVGKTGKYLIISGLLKGQEREVIEAYTKANPSLKEVAVLVKNDWSAALLMVDDKGGL